MTRAELIDHDHCKKGANEHQMLAVGQASDAENATKGAKAMLGVAKALRTSARPPIACTRSAVVAIVNAGAGRRLGEREATSHVLLLPGSAGLLASRPAAVDILTRSAARAAGSCSPVITPPATRSSRPVRTCALCFPTTSTTAPDNQK